MENIIKLICNLSSNSEYHIFIATEELLQYLFFVFENKYVPIDIKEKV